MSLPNDPHTHPGCSAEAADRGGVHNSQFCIFCLRKIGDDADLRARTAMTRAEELDEQLTLVLADAYARGYYGPVHATAELTLLRRVTPGAGGSGGGA